MVCDNANIPLKKPLKHSFLSQILTRLVDRIISLAVQVCSDVNFQYQYFFEKKYLTELFILN